MDDLFRITRDRTLWGKYPKALELLLKKGEMVFLDLSPGDIPWMVTAGVIIGASPEKVYSVITDFTKYTEFMPQLDSVEQYDPGDGFPEVTFTLGFRFAYIIPLTLSYTYKYLLRPPLRIDWVGIREGKACDYGYWELVPLDGGKKTAALYNLYSTPQGYLLKKIIKKNPQLHISTILSTALIVGQKTKVRAEGDRPLPPEHGGSLTEKDVIGNGFEALGSRGIFLLIEEPDAQGRKFVTGGTLVRGSPLRMWDSITDLNARPIIFPEVEKTVLLSEDHEAQLTQLDLKINFVLFSRRHSLVLKNVMDKPRRLSSSWVKGDAQGTASTWDLFPVNGGKETLAVHRYYSDLMSTSFIARYILSRQPAFDVAFKASWVSSVVKGFKAWTEMSEEQREEARTVRAKERKASYERYPAIPGY